MKQSDITEMKETMFLKIYAGRQFKKGLFFFEENKYHVR